MSRFAHVLRRAELELTLPEPQRSRILLEMAQDLDDLYASYRREGIDADEAARRAEAVLGVTGPAANALTDLHSPRYEKLLGRLASRTRGLVDVTLLTLLTLSALASSVAVLARSPRFGDPDIFTLALMAVLGVGAWCGGSVVIRHSVRHDPTRARGFLQSLLALCAASLCVGALGAVFELRTLAAAVTDTLHTIASLARIAELLVMAVGVSLLLGLVWFHLQRRTAAALRPRERLGVWLHPSLNEEERG